MDYNDADDLRKHQADAAEDADHTAEARCTAKSPHGDTCSLPDGHEDLHRTDGASWGARRGIAPTLADTADPGYAERIGKLRDRVEAIVKSGPVPGSRADREEDRDIKEALRQRAETHPEDPLPQREPGAALSADAEQRGQCGNTSVTGGWADAETRCTLPAGHKDLHVDVPRSISWGDAGPCPARERIGGTALACGLTKGHAGACEWPGAGDAFAAEHARIVESLASHRPVLLPVPEPAVRVRFIQLPSMPGYVKIPGMESSVPGWLPSGFALVVDRFRDQAHRDAECALWRDFGAEIGAKALIIYVGTLDTDDLLIGS